MNNNTLMLKGAKSILTFLIVLSGLFLIAPETDAESMDEFISKQRDIVDGNYPVLVTNYKCDSNTLFLIVTGATGYFIFHFINPALASVLITTFILLNSNTIACWWSYVRNPVSVFPVSYNKNSPDYDKANKYRNISTVDGVVRSIAVDKYENATPTRISEYMTICFRLPFPYYAPWSLDDLEREEAYFKTNDAHVFLLRMTGPTNCSLVKGGDKTTIYATTYSTRSAGGQVCAEITSSMGIPVMPTMLGCHPAPNTGIAPMCDASRQITDDETGKIIGYDNSPCFNCYMAPVCWDSTRRLSQAFVPITGVIMQCVRETMEIVTTGQSIDSLDSGALAKCPSGGLLKNAQSKLYSTLQALIALYICMFGFKILMGGEPPKRKEVSSFFVKAMMVMYFSSPDGGMDYYSNALRYLTYTMSNMFSHSAGNSTVCNYDDIDYSYTIGTRTIDSNYMRMWDALDCRMAFYLGTPFIGIAKASTEDTYNAVMLSFAFIPAFFLSGDVILFLITLINFFITVGICMWLLQIFLLASILLSVLIVMSPLFIPMALFGYTKNFFDSWLKEVIAFSLYPVCSVAFYAFFVSVMDDAYFGKIPFIYKDGMKVMGKETRFFFMDTEKDPYKNDRSNVPLGYYMNDLMATTEFKIFGIVQTRFTTSEGLGYLKSSAEFLLMLILMHYFSGLVGTIIGEVSGGSRAAIEMGQSAGTPISNAMQAAQKTKSAASTVKGGLAKGASKIGSAISGKKKDPSEGKSRK